MLDTADHTCINIMEWDDGSLRCSDICTDSNGSYSCSCDANDFLEGDGFTCSFDFCADNNNGCAHYCDSDDGSCSCMDGWEVDPGNRKLIQAIVVIVSITKSVSQISSGILHVINYAKTMKELFLLVSTWLHS